LPSLLYRAACVHVICLNRLSLSPTSLVGVLTVLNATFQTVGSFVGMDVHKETISIGVAEDRRNGPVRLIGASSPTISTHREDGEAIQASRLKVTGPCYAGFQLPDQGPRAVLRERTADVRGVGGDEITIRRRNGMVRQLA
jgi:hypothetical protein